MTILDPTDIHAPGDDEEYVEHVWAFAPDLTTIYCQSCDKTPAQVFSKQSCDEGAGGAVTFVGWSASGRPLFSRDRTGEVYEA